MKRIFFLFAMIASTLVVSAQQSVHTGKFFDNWSLGIGGGVTTPMDFDPIFPLNPTAGISIEKQFTPVFALEADGTAFFGSHGLNNTRWGQSVYGNYNAFRRFWVGLNGITNLSNLFGGYLGKPRCVELNLLAGLGWQHTFTPHFSDKANNDIAAKTGLAIDFNLGRSKATTIRFQPYVLWDLNEPGNSYGKLAFNREGAQLGAELKFICHFKNSNGTHYFTLCDKKYTQAEMDALNDRINAMRAKAEADLSVKNKTIADLQAELAAEKAKEKTVIVNKTVTQTTTQLAPVVIFQLGKSTIDASQKPSVAMIATYMKNHPTCKVHINGYASPEGNPELNQKLSDARAKAVYDMLVGTYKISPDRLTHKGLGATDELFDENDWNRVATFIEQSK